MFFCNAPHGLIGSRVALVKYFLGLADKYLNICEIRLYSYIPLSYPGNDVAFYWEENGFDPNNWQRVIPVDKGYSYFRSAWERRIASMPRAAAAMTIWPAGRWSDGG